MIKRTETLCTACGQVTSLGSTCDHCDCDNPEAASRVCPDCEGAGRFHLVRGARSTDAHPDDRIVGSATCECDGTGVAETPYLAESTAFNFWYNAMLDGPGSAAWSREVSGSGALADATRLGLSWGRNRWFAARWESRRSTLDPWTCPLEEIPMRPPFKELREVEPAWLGKSRRRAAEEPNVFAPCPICGFAEAVRMGGYASLPEYIYCGFCSRVEGRQIAKTMRKWGGHELVPAGLGGEA